MSYFHSHFHFSINYFPIFGCCWCSFLFICLEFRQNYIKIVADCSLDACWICHCCLCALRFLILVLICLYVNVCAKVHIGIIIIINMIVRVVTSDSYFPCYNWQVTDITLFTGTDMSRTCEKYSSTCTHTRKFVIMRTEKIIRVHKNERHKHTYFAAKHKWKMEISKNHLKTNDMYETWRQCYKTTETWDLYYGLNKKYVLSIYCHFNNISNVTVLHCHTRHIPFPRLFMILIYAYKYLNSPFRQFSNTFWQCLNVRKQEKKMWYIEI